MADEAGMMDAAQTGLLQQMPVFGGVREDTLDFLLRHARRVAKTKGHYFFREGDPGDALFVLEAGRAAVVKGRGRTRRVLSQLAKGDCFGEMAIMALAPRSASVQAVEDCRAIEISAGCLQQLAEHDLEQFTLIEMNLGREVARRLRRADELLGRGFPGRGGGSAA